MTINENKEGHFWRNAFTRFVLVLITVTVIVWFLPRNEGQQYKYDIGKPWMYGSFIAKFDFPIYKTDETIKKEQNALLEGFEPYYRYNANVEKTQIEKFKKDFKNSTSGLPEKYIDLIADRLHRLYKAGIMNTPEYNSIYKDSTAGIRLINGKVVQSTEIGCLYSTMSAYEKLFLDEKIQAKRAMLQHCNLNNYIEPNVTYEKEKSETEINDIMAQVPIASGMVLTGQKVIDRGEIVNEKEYRILSSFEKESKRRNATREELTSTVIGQVMFVFILVSLFTTYLILFRKDYFDNYRKIMMVYLLITIYPIIVSMMMSHNFFNVYILPFAMAPMFVRVFLDSRTAFMAHVTMILICAAAVKYQYEFIIVQLVAGLVAIFSLRELSKRAQVIKTAFLVTLGSAAVYFAMQMMQDNTVFGFDESMYIYLMINGVFLLLSYPLMYLIEKLFGFTSDVTLFELSNTNKGVLRDLSEIAPGTFQHSITVGNLAAEIANHIDGVNGLLVRTGALYHDIGKMQNPVFFTENQAGINPHDNMPYKQSASIIISHVTDGLKLAERYNLPREIKDFILTHHGRGMARYFYIKYKNEHPEEEIDPTPFSYPGPNPFTREQAILMISDAVEAASRSLDTYTEQSITDLVNKLVDNQVSAGYFKECPITFRDIATAKKVLIERLKAIYHTRISYPELSKELKEKEEKALTDQEVIDKKLLDSNNKDQTSLS